MRHTAKSTLRTALVIFYSLEAISYILVTLSNGRYPGGNCQLLRDAPDFASLHS